MSNFKRKKPRHLTGGSYSNAGRSHIIGDVPGYKWSRETPRWWNKTQHIRPDRRKERALEKAVLRGADHENLAWPLRGRKPHNYFH